MHAVILAAGRGKRLGGATANTPKGMVEVAGCPLLEWQRRALFLGGATDVTIITGYRGELISECGFNTAVNQNWSRGNMLTSLTRAFDLFDGPLIVSYSDILYEPATVKALISCPARLSITYDPDWLGLWARRFDNPLIDAETFQVDTIGRVMEIGHRPKGLEDVHGQFMGLLKIEPDARAWIHKVLLTHRDAEFEWDTTRLLANLLSEGRVIQGVKVIGGWCEIDSPSDLVVAQELIKEGKLNLSWI